MGGGGLGLFEGALQGSVGAGDFDFEDVVPGEEGVGFDSARTEVEATQMERVAGPLFLLGSLRFGRRIPIGRLLLRSVDDDRLFRSSRRIGLLPRAIVV